MRDYFQLQIKICMGIKLNAPAVQSVCEVFSCMVLSLRTGWDAHSGGVYIRNGHLVFKKKSLPYQILALWHQLREAFYLSAYKMTSFITLLYLVIFWWLLFEIEKKKKRARERLCICPIPQPRIAAGCKTIYKPKSSFYKLTVQSFAAPQLYCWYRRIFAGLQFHAHGQRSVN